MGFCTITQFRDHLADVCFVKLTIAAPFAPPRHFSLKATRVGRGCASVWVTENDSEPSHMTWPSYDEFYDDPCRTFILMYIEETL